MRYVLPFLVVFALCAAQLASAQVSVFPSSPREQETVRVRVPTGQLGLDVHGAPDTYDPRGTTMTMTNNKIVVSLLMVGNDGFARNPVVDWPLGQLPPGSYEVEVVKRSVNGVNQGLLGRASFAVAPRETTGPLLDFTDLYWNPSESGWGVSVTRLESGGLFLIWFVYGSDNKPTWYFVSNGDWVTPSRFRGTVYRSEGSEFGSTIAGTYDATRYRATPVGNAEIAFSTFDYGMAELVFTIDGITRVKGLTRQRL